MDRRECLKLGVGVAATAALAGCNQVLAPLEVSDEKIPLPPPGKVEPEKRLLNRLAFGSTPKELKSLNELGQEAYVAKQLKAEDREPLGLMIRLNHLDVEQLEPSDLYDLPSANVLMQLQQAAIIRAVYSNNQLKERMVDFWSNHFNIFSRKGNTVFSKGLQESQAIRVNALGTFPQMLSAMAHSPAMLEYLDNSKNAKGVANENYARELMELHTLGLGGGYTQKDVQEVARCFTGWTIEDRFLHPRGLFRFDPDRHDDDEKLVLGQRIPANGGVDDGLKVLDILAMHPSTARFLSRKLSRYFLGEESPKWIDSMSEGYLRTRGDIPQVIGPMLASRDILDAPPIVKRPFDYMVASVRAVAAQTDGSKPIQDHLAAMGEPLYQWPMPDGYPDKTTSWAGSMLPRWNFAFALCSGEIAGTDLHGLDVPTIASLTAKGPGGSGEAMAAALCLASPEFQWR